MARPAYHRYMIAIRRFDPLTATRGEWTAFHEFRHARDREEDPGEPGLDDAEFERMARRPLPLYENHRWSAWVGGVIAGGCGASFRRAGTPDYEDHAAHVSVWGGVREPWRRFGIATAMLIPLSEAVSRRGKTVVTSWTSSPSGDAFLLALGASAKHRQVENRAAVDAFDWEMLARWRAAAVPPDAALRWEVHAGRVPRDRIDALIPQLNALTADLPNGTLDEPPPRFELASWLSWYEELDRHGGEHAMVMLMEGEIVAAVCETVWDARFADRVYQRLTAVAPSWRGRGLAKGIKAAMVQLIRDQHPEVSLLETSNAEDNAPMLSINRRLGFAEHRRTTTYQISVATLAAALDRRKRRP